MKGKTHIEDLVNVLFFQIRPCHHPSIEVNLSLEAHFTQSHICGLHIMDGPVYNK